MPNSVIVNGNAVDLALLPADEGRILTCIFPVLRLLVVISVCLSYSNPHSCSLARIGNLASQFPDVAQLEQPRKPKTWKLGHLEMQA